MPTSTISVRRRIHSAAADRAQRTIVQARLTAPATVANRARNAHAETSRHARWAPARDAAWQLISPLMTPRTRIAIVGAGNGDTLPLGRIAAHARELTLVDLDRVAIRAARRRQPRTLRARIDILEHDVTLGAADAIAAAAGEVPASVHVPERPLPGSPYDLVIGDLFYSQLLYPALRDLEVAERRITAILGRYGPLLTRLVVSRLHVSAPYRPVIHIHDPIAWWPGHAQPLTIDEILSAAQQDPETALALARTGTGPHHADPRHALHCFQIPIRHTMLWRWPFDQDVDYLAAATVAGAVTTAPPRQRDLRSHRQAWGIRA